MPRKIQPPELGNVYYNKYNEEYRIIELTNSRNCLIEFTESGQVQYCARNTVGVAKVFDWSKPQLHGIGYSLGTREKPDDHTNIGCVSIHSTWENMITRCYKGSVRGYSKAIVCKEWHNFMNFKDWYKENFYENCELDKDLFSVGGNKIYSPETCCFLPRKINGFLSNFSEYIKGESKHTDHNGAITLKLANLLFEFKGTFTPKAEERLWNFCRQHGITPETLPNDNLKNNLEKAYIEIAVLKEKIRQMGNYERFLSDYGQSYDVHGFLKCNGQTKEILCLQDLEKVRGTIRRSIEKGIKDGKITIEQNK